jgi:hypothetical protein
MRQPNGKRGRSRGRKGGHNQLNRTLESNGPDVKIRGSASHIHEKYLALARDASSSGDRVGAENYLQHAEHYHRLMMAAMPQGQPVPQQASQTALNGDDSGVDDEAEGPETGEALPPQYQPQHHREQRESRAEAGERSERSDGEGRSEGRGGRRLNGRSRRVSSEERAGRAITSLEKAEGESAAPVTVESVDDGDEALA